MQAEMTFFDTLPGLFSYPGSEYLRDVERCRVAMRDAGPEAAAAFEAFSNRIRGLSPEELEETFVRVFDCNPPCALEVGWHLFGEEYHRGAFLAKMRRELKISGIEESAELPDHLSHILPLLGRMAPDAAVEFAHACVFPALEKMLEGHEQMSDSPYGDLLKTVYFTLTDRFGKPVREEGAS